MKESIKTKKKKLKYPYHHIKNEMNSNKAPLCDPLLLFFPYNQAWEIPFSKLKKWVSI